MKILLVYFTGTGNTRYITDRVQSALQEHGHLVDRVEIQHSAPIVSAEGYDLIGFGYPIYGFNSPLPFNRYVKQLNIARGQKYFIYKNSGETMQLNNASDRILIRRMKRKKAVLAGQYHFIMPYNIHFPFDYNLMRELLEKDEKLLAVMIYNLEHGICKTISDNALYDLASVAVSIQKVGGPFNSFFYKVDTDKCVRCMKCVDNCPEENIRVKDGKIVFGRHCSMCMRCSFFCPTDAIGIGMLNGWKVTNYYDLAKIAADHSERTPYITEDTKGFFKCYIRTFRQIDEDYAALFSEREQAAAPSEAALTSAQQPRTEQPRAEQPRAEQPRAEQPRAEQ